MHTTPRDAVRTLTAAISQLDGPANLSFTIREDGLITLDQRPANALLHMISANDGQTSRAGEIARRCLRPAGGMLLDVDSAFALARAINDLAHAQQRARQIFRGRLPGALTAREAIQVSRMLGGGR